jgi:urea transport system ATP-binding protein
MGRNGVGKTSSLMRAIVGQQAIVGGRSAFERRGSSNGCAARIAAGRHRYVPQGREVFPLLTVKENLETGLRR